MTQSTGELERQAEASREALQRDVGALKEKVRPKRMMGDAVARAKDKGRAMAARTGAQAKDLAVRTTSQAKGLAAKTTAQAKANPVPFAVAGGAVLAGAAWLVARSWKKRRDGAA